MVEEDKNDVITKAHLAAERLERANELNKELVERMEKAEARMLLGGLTAAGEPVKPALTEEEKTKIDARNYFKGGMLEGVFK